MSFSTYKIKITKFALCNGNYVNVIFHEEKTFKAYVCQMCGKYAKTKSEIINLF